MAFGKTQSTCFPNVFSQGSRIDCIFCNCTALHAATDFTLVHGSGLPTHRPVMLQLLKESYQAKVLQQVMPRAFPVSDWENWELEKEEDVAL
eukprot:5278669-Karenia_brevis.AAC.1